MSKENKLLICEIGVILLTIAAAVFIVGIPWYDWSVHPNLSAIEIGQKHLTHVMIGTAAAALAAALDGLRNYLA